MKTKIVMKISDLLSGELTNEKFLLIHQKLDADQRNALELYFLYGTEEKLNEFVTLIVEDCLEIFGTPPYIVSNLVELNINGELVPMLMNKIKSAPVVNFVTLLNDVEELLKDEGFTDEEWDHVIGNIETFNSHDNSTELILDRLTSFLEWFRTQDLQLTREIVADGGIAE